MTEPLNFTIKGNADEFENVAVEIHNSLKNQNLSEFEAKKQIMIMRGLVENGIKLDDALIGSGNITIHIFIEQKSVTVEVRKPVSQSSYARLEALDKAIQWIRGYQSPLDPYIKGLKEISSKSQKSQSIAHRLAKLAYETEAVLDFYVTENSILNLSAIRYLSRKTVR
jgi:hypothetical protein